MKLNNIFILFFLLFSSISAQKFDFSSNFSIGYDSNPMKLSKDELDKSTGDIFLDKYNVNSKYLKFSLKLKTSKKIFKRKSKFEFGFKRNIFQNLSQKTNFGLSLKWTQPIGNYQYLKFSHSYIPDIFLREFNDESYSNYYYEVSEPLDLSQLGNYECYFNLGKTSMTYESPYFANKSRIAIGYIYETHFYNKFFTQFDLRINGLKVTYFAKKDKIKSSYSISYIYNFAENITLNDDSPHRAFMDRGYTENGLKARYEYKDRKYKVGLSLDNKFRQYRSHVHQDKLHYNRDHLDVVFSMWCGFKINGLSQKINFSKRTRKTNSPENWVEELKTFDRIDLSYTIFFKKISFRMK